MKKRSFMLPLCISCLLLAAAGVSCSDGRTTADTSAISGENAAVTEAVTEPGEVSGVPADVKFDNTDINIWYVSYDTAGDVGLFGEDSGEALDTATYYKNLAVEEKLGVKLNFIASSDGEGGSCAEILRIMTADDTSFDVFFATQWQCALCIPQGVFLNIADAPYISFDKNWWDVAYMREMSIGDTIFTLVGDYSVDRLNFLSCVYYNKNLYNSIYSDDISYGGGDGMYARVKDGTWTWDTIRTVAKDVYVDLNNDGKTDAGDRVAAALACNDDINSLLYNTGFRFTERDADGIPQIIAMQTDRLPTLTTELYDFCYHTPGIYYSNDWDYANKDSDCDIFRTGSSMFLFDRFNNAYRLRDMEDEYGIIPFPKYDETQGQYYSCMFESLRFAALPSNCQKIDAVCAVMEQMAYEGNKTMMPVFYETVLKSKYARDSVSGEMIDIIRDNCVPEFAFIHILQYDVMVCYHRDLIVSGSYDIASYYAKREKKLQKKHEELLATYLDMDH